MLFCIDIGNTNIVIGIYQNEKLIESFRLQTDIYQTVDEYGIKISQVISTLNIKKEEYIKICEELNR